MIVDNYKIKFPVFHMQGLHFSIKEAMVVFNPSMLLSADLFACICRELDFVSYTRLLSTCKLARETLTPGQEALMNPHFEEIMSAMIRIERKRVAEAGYDLCLRREPFLEFKHGNLKANFGVSSSRGTITVLVTSYESEQRLGSAIVSVTPSPDQPFLSGVIRLVRYVPKGSDPNEKTHESHSAYKDGFRAILRSVACEMCPVRPVVDAV